MWTELGKADELVLAISGDGQGVLGSVKAVESFAATLGIIAKPTGYFLEASLEKLPNNISLEKRQFDEMQAHVQGLLKKSAAFRAKKWNTNAVSATEWRELGNILRKWVQEELIGRLPHKKLSFNPRTRRVIANKHFVAYEVMLDVFPDVLTGGLCCCLAT